MTLTGILQRIYESAMHAKSYAPSEPVMAYLEAIQRDTQSIAAIAQPESAPADARTQAKRTVRDFCTGWERDHGARSPIVEEGGNHGQLLLEDLREAIR